MTAAPGTASTSISPQCAARLGGHIEITADGQTLPPLHRAAQVSWYGLSGARAYCSVVVGGGGPYAPEDSHNIDVVDDVALGNYSVTFLTPMASNEYAVVLTSGCGWHRREFALENGQLGFVLPYTTRIPNRDCDCYDD